MNEHSPFNSIRLISLTCQTRFPANIETETRQMIHVSQILV